MSPSDKAVILQDTARHQRSRRGAARQHALACEEQVPRVPLGRHARHRCEARARRGLVHHGHDALALAPVLGQHAGVVGGRNGTDCLTCGSFRRSDWTTPRTATSATSRVCLDSVGQWLGRRARVPGPAAWCSTLWPWLWLWRRQCEQRFGADVVEAEEALHAAHVGKVRSAERGRRALDLLNAWRERDEVAAWAQTRVC
jgi:hypothetical protein